MDSALFSAGGGGGAALGYGIAVERFWVFAADGGFDPGEVKSAVPTRGCSIVVAQ